MAAVVILPPAQGSVVYLAALSPKFLGGTGCGSVKRPSTWTLLESLRHFAQP